MSTYCFTDLHSNYEIWKQIKNYIKPTDTVYCLGDCIDRGDCGLEILLEILDMPNIILLKGNHEEFLLNYGQTYIDYSPINQTASYLWLSNGGHKCLSHFEKLDTKEQIELIEKVNDLPTWTEYINKQNQKIFMCHAGANPKTIEHIHCVRGFYENNYLWDREHIWIDRFSWKGESNEYCVHGHTPVMIIDPKQDKDPNIIHYCEGHKIDLDLASFITNKACLLNLDTWEEIYFISKEEQNG